MYITRMKKNVVSHYLLQKFVQTCLKLNLTKTKIFKQKIKIHFNNIMFYI